MCCAKAFSLYWPHRRQASSHRITTAFGFSGIPVGAGLPAIGPDRLMTSPGHIERPVAQYLGHRIE
ncbi:hypothetical protein D8767_27580 [Pseudomonas sp. LTGT-11-2Z]|nr:hypothetical protein D8767_27580 [Pseudomonas sp. LTGT-11-2Z]